MKKDTLKLMVLISILALLTACGGATNDGGAANDGGSTGSEAPTEDGLKIGLKRAFFWLFSAGET